MDETRAIPAENAPERVVVVDVETTGTDTRRDQIIEFAARLGLGPEATTWRCRIRPTVPIPPDAVAIHGISDSDLANEQPFVARADRIYSILAGADVIAGYNLSFDLAMIRAAFERAHLSPPDLAGKVLVDPYVLWRRREPRTLGDAHRRFAGAELHGAHGAVADTAATARVLTGMLGAFDLTDRSWEEISKEAWHDKRRRRPPSRHPVILFDGVCNFCAGWVRFVLARDRAGRFRFASLQSDVARDMIDRIDPSLRETDSIVLCTGEQAYVKSDAALRILRGLGRGWPLVYGFVVLPRILRDGVYDFIARNRYRWFGRSDTCMIPPPEVRSRFLDADA